MRRIVMRVLCWIGKACNLFYWAGYYFILPPDENNAEEMHVYNRRYSK